MNLSPLSHKSCRQPLVLDRRLEERTVAEGEAVVVPSDLGSQLVEATLMDTSDEGFRIRYAGASPLFSGQEVQFLLLATSGVARVIWTRVLDGSAESGFLILRSRSWPK
jgi:hypothetical protein